MHTLPADYYLSNIINRKKIFSKNFEITLDRGINIVILVIVDIVQEKLKA